MKTRDILQSIKVLIEDNGNLHEQLMIGGHLDDFAVIDCGVIDEIKVSSEFSDMLLTINGKKYYMKLESVN